MGRFANGLIIGVVSGIYAAQNYNDVPNIKDVMAKWVEKAKAYEKEIRKEK